MKYVYRIMVLMAGLVTATAAVAAEWRVVQPESRIGFIATYDDIPFDARFQSFKADIHFDPDDLDNAAFDIRIDVSSVDSNSVDRDEGMRQEEWLAADAHPVARFQAKQFEKLSPGRYKAIGTLALKDVRRDVAVPFEWRQESDGTALLSAATTLRRGDFKIGTGEWAEDDTIGFEVKVEAELTLAPQT